MKSFTSGDSTSENTIFHAVGGNNGASPPRGSDHGDHDHHARHADHRPEQVLSVRSEPVHDHPRATDFWGLEDSLNRLRQLGLLPSHSSRPQDAG